MSAAQPIVAADLFAENPLRDIKMSRFTRTRAEVRLRRNGTRTGECDEIHARFDATGAGRLTLRLDDPRRMRVTFDEDEGTLNVEILTSDDAARRPAEW